MFPAAVWSLGHIAAASEEACKAVLCERLDLLEWMTNQVVDIPRLLLSDIQIIFWLKRLGVRRG